MAVYAPNTDLRLLSAPLTFGDGNQLDFASAAAQRAYFSSLPGRNFVDFTYQRKDSVIRIPDLAENLYQYNYVMYQNFAGKWIYGFITRIEFINQNCTHVHIKTDVFQTWQFDFTFKQCLVEREHTVTDRPYEHTLPENIETGEPVEIYRKQATVMELNGDTAAAFDANFKVVFCLSEQLKNTGVTLTSSPMCGGVPPVAWYYAVSRPDVIAMSDFITSNAQAEAVISVYACPNVPGRNVFIDMQASTPFPIYSVHDTNETEKDAVIPKAYYVPHSTVQSTPYAVFQNRKCLCYPFHYFKLWTSDGQSVDLKVENFNHITRDLNPQSITMRTTLNPAQDASLICAPENYLFTGRGVNQSYGANYSYSVTYTAFPEMAFATDVFKNYLALNKNSIRATMFNTAVNTVFGVGRGALSGVQGAVSMLGGIAGLDLSAGPGTLQPIVGAGQQIMGAGQQIYNTVGNAMSAYAKFQDMQRVPDRIRGVSSVGAIMLTSSPGVYLSEMCLKPEYLALVDQYFTKFGYSVLTVKTPQFKSRVNHNYLKTADCNIEAEAPQDDIDELCAMFNSGLTVWHNPATFGNFSVNNQPVNP